MKKQVKMLRVNFVIRVKPGFMTKSQANDLSQRHLLHLITDSDEGSKILKQCNY